MARLLRLSYAKKQILFGSVVVFLGLIVCWELIMVGTQYRLMYTQPLLYVGLAFLLGLPLSSYYVVRNYWKGEVGEAEVERILRNLPRSYHVLRKVVLGTSGDIDVVVISPTSIWAVEVKNIRDGQITFENGLLCRNRYPLEGNPLGQSYHQAAALQTFLREQYNLYVPVTPVLVFANYRNTMRFGFRDVKGVHVIGIKLLIELLQKQTLPHPLSPQQCLVLSDGLKHYAN